MYSPIVNDECDSHQARPWSTLCSGSVARKVAQSPGVSQNVVQIEESLSPISLSMHVESHVPTPTLAHVAPHHVPMNESSEDT